MGKRKAETEQAQEEGTGLSAYERERQLLCETLPEMCHSTATIRCRAPPPPTPRPWGLPCCSRGACAEAGLSDETSASAFTQPILSAGSQGTVPALRRWASLPQSLAWRKLVQSMSPAVSLLLPSPMLLGNADRIDCRTIAITKPGWLLTGSKRSRSRSHGRRRNPYPRRKCASRRGCMAATRSWITSRTRPLSSPCSSLTVRCELGKALPLAHQQIADRRPCCQGGGR